MSIIRSMRISSLTVNGFRGWVKEETFDLDADAVVVIAANGQGKTSLFDAIMWSLTGVVPRIGGDEYIISKYSESGQASTSITLFNGQSTMTVSRLFDGANQSVSLVVNDEHVVASSVQDRIMELLWPAALAAPQPLDALVAAFERSIYLQQDLVRDFIQDANDQTRYSAVSEIVGTGRVTELQVKLENAKKMWTQATNERYEESASLRQRVAFLEDQLRSLRENDVELNALDKDWSDWWKASSTIVEDTKEPVAISSVRASGQLDVALKEISAKQLAVGRETDRLLQLQRFQSTRPSVLDETQSSLRLQEASSLEAQISELEKQLVAARAQQKALEDAEAERAQAAGEMAQLARLSLKHLDEHCPVCQQTYDKSKTRKRLETLLDAAGVQKPSRLMKVDLVSPIMRSVDALVKRRAGLDAEMRRHASESEQLDLWSKELERRLAQAGLSEAQDVVSSIAARVAELRSRTEMLDRLQSQGERLATQLARASEAQRRLEAQSELSVLAADLDKVEKDHKSRERTGDEAAKILDALRDSAFDLVTEHLKDIEPLLQRIYETADPHPAFKVVRLLGRLYHGRGRLTTEIDDPNVKKAKSTSPASLLSSSQLNVLAVSMFLALNLGVKTLPLQCAILDDPLQSLDDLNLLGLVDVLRQVKDRRQLFISTHDSRFGALLKRKLRAVSDKQRTRIVELTDWSRLGPVVTQYDVPHEVWSQKNRTVAG